MGIRRSGKEYRRNEKEVMERLGLRPTKNSGSGWIEKEDGISEDVICQLKSTDANSIRVEKQDLDTLQYHALVSHKLPVFAIQFMGSNEIYLVLKPEVLEDLAKYLKNGEAPRQSVGIEQGWFVDTAPVKPGKTVRSSQAARNRYHEELETKYTKRWRSAT